MNTSRFLANSSAVNEVIGGVLLVLIAVGVSVLIYAQALPVPFPSPEPNVYLRAYVTEDGQAVVEHIGGETLSSYEVHVTQSSNTSIYKFQDNPWEIGECYFPPLNSSLFTEDREIDIAVYCTLEDGSYKMVFDGLLIWETDRFEIPVCLNPMLISNLRTDSVDEDLICYDNGSLPDENVTRYIFKWLLNTETFAEVLMPFDSNNSTITKDYSGNGNDGTLHGPIWIDEGRVGGAYSFDGGSDFIELPLLNFFDDLSSNDFTISLWAYSKEIDADHRMLVEGGKNNKNFALIFQMGSEIHFGVCENGVKRAVRSDTLSNDIWYHVAGVWYASEKSLELYVNGMLCPEVGYRNYASGVQQGFDLGHGTASSRFWNGFMDELQLFDRALSADQIDQIYRANKDEPYNNSVIVSSETLLGDIWQCIVIPNDGIQDLPEIASNILQIKPYSGGD